MKDISTISDVESALDESGAEFFTAFHTRHETVWVKIRKSEAKELFEIFGCGGIQWSREDNWIYMDRG